MVSTPTDARKKVFDTIEQIEPVNAQWIDRAGQRLVKLTKPPDSLGQLEQVATRLCAIQATLKPVSMKRRIIVCAADHGVTVEGVSAYPQSVTAQMVTNMANGGAAINALARVARAGVWVIDVGVSGSLGPIGGKAKFSSHRVREGTANMAEGPAMSENDMLAAVVVGIEHAQKAAADGVALLGLGDMGIGNTTAASAITAVLTGLSPVHVTGCGTGIDQSALTRKINAIERALSINQPHRDRPFDILQTVGGLEIAALCGACLGAAGQRLAILIDGLISTAAAMIAVAACQHVKDYLFASHLSPEPGHKVQLEWLGHRPLLDLGMRLGEGTGASLAMNIIAAACAAFNEMATFESAHVSNHL